MSSTPSIELNELERDALAEVLNLGVSRAAANLRTMINQEVILSVPSVTIISGNMAAQMIGADPRTPLVAVRQTFEGDFYGRAMLIFPESNSLALVRAVTGGGLPVDDIVALEQEALTETGNIILNSCLATIANMLHRNLRMSLPEVVRGDGTVLFEQAGDTEDSLVLLLYINFSVNSREITGHIAMIMDLPALQALKQLLAGLISRAGGGAPSPHHAET